MRINGKQKEKYGRMTWNSVPSSTVQVFCLVARECNCYAKHRSCFIYSSFCTFPSVSRKAGAGTGVFQKKKKGEVYRTVAIGSNKNQREVLTLLFLCRYHYSPSVDRGDRFYYIRAAEYYTFARRR